MLKIILFIIKLSTIWFGPLHNQCYLYPIMTYMNDNNSEKKKKNVYFEKLFSYLNIPFIIWHCAQLFLFISYCLYNDKNLEKKSAFINCHFIQYDLEINKWLRAPGCKKLSYLFWSRVVQWNNCPHLHFFLKNTLFDAFLDKIMI